ncbi:GGDEF domain-containing protein [Pantoea stewartii]|uniref:GGDEF domain-containing protein n=1 Tax=Pantoea stewartii TaxID=66269 RepID=UPI0019815661|nr:GGDEF domain-containing protein [Pantoea stewartii]
MRAKLFEEHNAKKSAFWLFMITLMFCFVGGHLRIPHDLSLFWPVNVFIAGMMLRYPFLHRTRFYLICFSAMVFNDTVFSGWTLPAFTLNVANILFILICVIVMGKQYQHDSSSERISNALRIFPACLLAAFGCATWGALAQVGSVNAAFADAWMNWFSEQFSTGLMLLPFLLTPNWRVMFSGLRVKVGTILPLIAVGLSLTTGALMGGAGSLTLPVPALIWCAIVLPIPLTSLVTLITGISQIILVSHGVMHIQGDSSLLPISHLTSARLGVATLAISPLIVAVSVDAIRQLNERLALRADYDFLTQLLSRSGLYERLRNEPSYAQRQVGVILLDVDYFKSVNDNFGHDAGDSVLEEIARRISPLVGSKGHICRFGGEEFVVVQFDLSPEKIYSLAEGIRQSIVREKFVLQGNAVTVTVSLGLANGEAQPGTAWAETINNLISAADKNLYISKRNGRNQTSPGKTHNEMTSDVA